MKKVKVNQIVLKKKPTVCIDRNWFPYRAIVSPKRYERICCSMERDIQKCHLKKGVIYYAVVDFDEKGNPVEIVISYTTTKLLSEIEHIEVLTTKYSPKYAKDF